MSEMCCVARWKYRTQKITILVPLHNFVGLYLRSWGTYRQLQKKLVKKGYLLHVLLIWWTSAY